MFILTTEGLDENTESHPFSTKAEAIDYAVVWFVSGYDAENNDTLRNEVPLGIASDVTRLISDLTAGREFYCSRFSEKASIVEQPQRVGED